MSMTGFDVIETQLIVPTTVQGIGVVRQCLEGHLVRVVAGGSVGCSACAEGGIWVRDQ